MWNRWQRTGGEIESQRRAGRRMGLLVSDLIFPLSGTWKQEREMRTPWRLGPFLRAPSHRILRQWAFPFCPRRGTAQEWNGKDGISMLLWPRPCPCLGLTVCGARSTSSGMQNDFLILPALGNNIFNCWLNCKCPVSHLNKSRMYEIVHCVLRAIPSCKNRATRSRFLFLQLIENTAHITHDLKHPGGTSICVPWFKMYNQMLSWSAPHT